MNFTNDDNMFGKDRARKAGLFVSGQFEVIYHVDPNDSIDMLFSLVQRGDTIYLEINDVVFGFDTVDAVVFALNALTQGNADELTVQLWIDRRGDK